MNKIQIIKFRAWDKVRKIMYKDIEILAIYLRSGTIEVLPVKELLGIGTEIDLMRYIGVEDENNKEIYEGDIIEFMKDLRLIGYVAYEDCVFQIKYINIRGFKPKLLCGNWLKYYKVIGNIHENPELVNEESWFNYNKLKL